MVIAALIACPLAGCGASVSVHGGVISGDRPYRAIWKQSWEQIQRDETPYLATPTSPGACNAGSTKQACVDADQRIVTDLRRLRVSLRTVRVPGPYGRATTLILLALSQDLRGLTLRMRSLSVGNWTIAQRNAWFRQSKVELLGAR